MPNFVLTVSGRKTYAGNLDVDVSPVQWYMQKEDEDVFGYIRSCAPCPAVWVMKDDPHARLNQQHQYHLRAANYNMSLENVYLLLDDHLAWANDTGFPTLDNPGEMADFFFNRNTSSTKYPGLNKVRTSSRSIMTGTETFSLAQGLLDVVHAARMLSRRRMSFLGAQSVFRGLLARSENVLHVNVLDSRNLPLLKPGYSYPNDISEVDPNAYAIMPQTHPEMFLVANIVNRQGEVVQFPRGATYPWIDGGLTPYSFIPHMANLSYGPILYPMRNLYKVPLGSPKPRALRYE